MNSMRPASLAVVLVVLVVAGCGSPQVWQKPGAAETTVQNDSEDCRVQARQAPLPERYVPSPSAQSGPVPVPPREEEQRAVREAEAFQKCMIAKGYTAAKR